MSSKEVRFPTAIESLKGIVFVHNICTPAGWRKSFTGSVYEVVNLLLLFSWKQNSLKGYFYCLQVFSKGVLAIQQG